MNTHRTILIGLAIAAGVLLVIFAGLDVNVVWGAIVGFVGGASISGGASMLRSGSFKTAALGLAGAGIACIGMVGCSAQPRGDADKVLGPGTGVTMSETVYRATDNSGKPVQGTTIDPGGLHKLGNNGGRSTAIVIPMLGADGMPVLYDHEIIDGEGIVIGSRKQPVVMQLFLDDQSNTTIESLEIPFGEQVAVLRGFGADEAVRITAMNEQVIASLQAQVDITEAQVDAIRAQLEAGVDVVTALAEVGVRLVVPTP